MGNTDYNQNDVSISKLLSFGLRLVQNSSSKEAQDIKKFLDAKVYLKAYEVSTLLAEGYISRKAINVLQEQRTDINQKPEYFRQQSIRLLKIITPDLKQAAYERLIQNPFFKDLIGILADSVVQESANTIYNMPHRRGKELAYWLKHNQPNYFQFKNWWNSQSDFIVELIEEECHYQGDSLEVQVFILFEAISNIRRKIDLTEQLNNPLFKYLLDTTDKLLCTWLKQEQIISLDEIFYPSNNLFSRAFQSTLHGFNLTDSIAALRSNILYLNEVNHDVACLNSLYSSSCTNLLQLRAIIEKWKTHFKDNPKFLSLLPNASEIDEGNVKEVLYQLNSTWDHFANNKMDDFLSHYGNFLAIIDRWYAEAHYNQSLNRPSTLQDVEYAYTQFLTECDEKKLQNKGEMAGFYFLNYLFPRVYEQQNNILSGRAERSEVIQKRVIQLDYEINLVLNCFPDFLGNLSAYFWSTFGSPNFFNKEIGTHSIDREEPVSPRSGSPVQDISFFKEQNNKPSENVSRRLSWISSSSSESGSSDSLGSQTTGTEQNNSPVETEFPSLKL